VKKNSLQQTKDEQEKYFTINKNMEEKYFTSNILLQSLSASLIPTITPSVTWSIAVHTPNFQIFYEEI